MADEVITQDGEEPQHPLWGAPTIHTPLPNTVVSPGSKIKVSNGSTSPVEWRLHIMKNATLVKEIKGGGHSFETDMPAGIIGAGQGFYIKADYYQWPAWSSWAYSGDLVMGLDKPRIDYPLDNATASPRPKVLGRGTPGATVRLYEAGSGAILYGTAEVDPGGSWVCIPDKDLPTKYFPLTVDQVFNGLVSGYSDVVSFYVRPLDKPVIQLPQQGARVGTKPEVSGSGLPGASVRLHVHGDGHTVYNSIDVNPQGRWIMRSWSRELPKGEIRITANQTENHRDFSDWADGVDLIVS